MEKILKENKIDYKDEEIEEKEGNELCDARKEEGKKFIFVETTSELLGYGYYLEKLKEAKTQQESIEYAAKIFYDYLKKT